MSRISKSAVNHALEQASLRIVEAGGEDGKVSASELKAALAPASGAERALASTFYKFVEQRSGKSGAGVSTPTSRRPSPTRRTR